MSAATARGQVAEQLAKDNPTWQVLDYPAPAPADLRKPRAVVWRSELEPTSGAAGLALTHSLTLQVYGLRGAQGTSPEGETELDDLLDAAMLSLQRLDGLEFIKATRSTFADAFSGWELELRVTSPDVYRDAVITERATSGA